MLCILQNSIGGMMITEVAALRDALTIFQIVLERVLRRLIQQETYRHQTFSLVAFL